jgi:dihydropyrimidinase
VQYADTQCLIRNGVVVNATGRITADVLIGGGKILAIGEKLEPPSGRTEIIEADGTQLLPGGIDPHVHLAPFLDDFDTGSKAALAGGVTTIGVMSFVERGETIEAMLARHTREAAVQSRVDVVLHAVLNVETSPTPEALSAVVAAGQTTCKIFTMVEEFDREYTVFIALLHRARMLGLLPMFHCEDAAVTGEALRALQERQVGDLAHYEESRPALAEELAVQKVMTLCELTRCPVYIVHVSSARALGACEMAQARGLPVYVETRPIYLHFDAQEYHTPEGPLYVSFPPIRSAADGEALWRGLALGTVQTVGSDHAPLLREQKLGPTHCLADPRPGMSNLQEMLLVLYSEAVLRGRLSVERFVQVTSTNPAKLLSLYPRKGIIAVGADADITIWDPRQTLTFHAQDGYSRADFSLYEGWTLTGVPRMTIRRGEIAYRDGRITAVAGSGRVLSRRPAPTPPRAA